MSHFASVVGLFPPFFDSSSSDRFSSNGTNACPSLYVCTIVCLCVCVRVSKKQLEGHKNQWACVHVRLFVCEYELHQERIRTGGGRT